MTGTPVGSAVYGALSDLDCAELSITRRLAAEDRYISTDEVPWVDGIEINLLRADNRNGQFVLGPRSAGDSVLGKHRNRGPVTAVTQTWTLEVPRVRLGGRSR